MDELEQLASIFLAAVDRVDPYKMIVDHVRLDGSRLVVAFDGQRHAVDLDRIGRILVLGAGKASAAMAKAVEDVLGQRIAAGLVVVKYGHAESLRRVEVVEAGHPTPDENGVRAAARVAELARRADERTLVLNLISGGGSALLCSPLVVGSGDVAVHLTLGDKQAMTKALLACGADIGEINCLRKHLSRVKGGRLLQLMAPARSLNFILSDVVGDRLDIIASGVTTHDDTTFADALDIVDKYQLRDAVPKNVLQALLWGAEGRIPETLKAGDPATALATNILIGTNLGALTAACERARVLGYNAVALTSSLTGEAREAAKFLFGIARDVRNGDLLVAKPAFVIAGGETVVTLSGSGKGGRNQEMALAFLAEMGKDERQGRGIFFLSASTDGSDGPTDAAGAFASAAVLDRAREAGLSLEAYLRNNDSYHFFGGIGHLLKTGPTKTNVCDLHMMIVTDREG
jgi:hydroxypyruvate reductase